jgi:Domain of unknown function (DUF4105)
LLRRALSIALVLLACGAPGSARAEIDAWLERAEALGLDRHPTWQALLHMAPHRFGLGRASEIPGGRFFLAADGRTSPRAELEATLRALADRSALEDAAAHCRFPARARWLARELGLPPDRLAPTPCPALDEWRAGLAPRGITLIFPEAFMNNPASMFGHTLLRLDVADPSDPRNLLGYAIDFTANSEGDAGPVFMARGTFGLYPGYFGVNPYYRKLELYGDWQNRDIWEYPLDLGMDEVEFVLLHLWELDDVAIPYYFFRQNCSYQLLRLLAVARPELRLRRGFPVGVIPVDTVRDVIEQIGVAGEVRYRPSPATELTTLLDALAPEARRLALDLARGALAPGDERVARLAPAERGALLGAAYEAVKYAFLQGDLGEEISRERSYQLLAARSRAGPGGTPQPSRPAVRPDEGHGTALVALGAGVEDDEGFFELRVRPSFHGLLDPDAGFPADSTISVLDTRVRVFPASGRVRLEELVLVELQSKTPRDDVFRPLSWGLETGLRTRLFPERDGDLDRRLVWRTGGSLGLTYNPAKGPLTLYALADARLEVGSGFDGGFALGPGAELGLELKPPGERWQGRLFGRVTRFVAGDRETHLQLGLGQSLALTRRTAAVAEVGLQHYEGEGWLDARVSLQWTY